MAEIRFEDITKKFGDKVILDHINLDIEDDILTIKATRQNEESDEDSKRKFIRRERFYGSYTRSFDVSNIDTSAITAEYNDGILTLVLPKKAPEKPKTRHLDIL